MTSTESADKSAAATITEHEAAEVERGERDRARRPSCSSTACGCLPSSWDRWAAVFEEAGYTALTPGWPDDPETVEEANAHPEVFARKTVGQVADHYAAVIGGLEKKPAVIGHSFGGLLDPDRRRSRSARPRRRDRPGAVPRRAAAAALGAEVGVSGPRQPGEPQPRRPAHLRAVPLRVRQRGQRGRGERALRDVRRAGRGHAALPGRHRQPQPVDRGEGRQQEPRPRPAADRLRREGPHRPMGDRQCLLQEAEAATRA